MSKVAIVLPVYKSQPSLPEIQSFTQCLQVLGKYPLLLATPSGLDVTAYNDLAGRELQCVSFEERFFKSVTGYSELLVNRRFYNRFVDYDYILIYQLDAWVFRDELLQWCAQDFDYIGAPWLKAPPVTTKKSFTDMGFLLKNKVGNGGVSLRKVRSHLRWSWWVSFIFTFFPKNEDMLWTLFVPFRKPKTDKALHFAFELEPRLSYQRTGNTLPFACHAWQKYEPDFWQKFIHPQ